MDSVLLRSFVETAEAGSLSRAARRLGLSQPSITGQVQRLEQTVGAALFERHGRGVRLTEAGAALYPRARTLLEGMREAADAVRREGGVAAGTVRVGAIPTVAPYVMPVALARWRSGDGGARVELREDFSVELARALHEGALDVVIAALPYGFDGLMTEVLGVDRLLVAVPASHAAARAGRITLPQLHASPAITLDPAHCLGEQVAGFCASREIRPSVVCRTAQLATVLELVGAGVGVSIVPALAAVRYNTPECVYVPLEGHPLQREIVAVYRREGDRHAAVPAFVACVRDALRAR